MRSATLLGLRVRITKPTAAAIFEADEVGSNRYYLFDRPTVFSSVRSRERMQIQDSLFGMNHLVSERSQLFAVGLLCLIEALR